MTDETNPEHTPARHEVVAVLYANDYVPPAFFDAVRAQIPDADDGARFTRVSGDAQDTSWAYVGLPGSTVATTPHVYVVACRAKTTDVHAFLASLPWGAAGAGVAIFNGTDKAKVQVNVLGRWAQ